MNKRTRYLVIFAVGHLVLVISGAAGLRLLPSASGLGGALRWYGAVSGADSSYGFFAPNVGPDARAVLTIVDDTGRSWTEPLDEAGNQEVRLRLGNVASQGTEGHGRLGLAASWAARAFGRHPQASVVTVRVEIYDIPTMQEFRNGEGPEWVTVYQRAFRRGDDTASVKGGV
jgi:hypothetical protein